ncbi:MAG TPA: MFS transporter [Longimicrobiaceae bacterium]|nr:MFS transporter [Longimicrobiaceae bacterium]
MFPDRGPPTQLPDAPKRPPAAPLATGAFAALGHRNFRLFWLGQLLSLTGNWMQSTAQGWLVLDLTNSEFLLGVVTAAGSLPVLLFTLYAGVVADRRDKRRIILTAQGCALLLALALAILTHTGLINLGWIVILVLLLGVAHAFEVPTRQSFFVDLVGKQDLTNAIALNSAAFNLTRIIGPAVAGLLIGSVGIAAVFYLNAFSYAGVIIGLLLIRLPRFQPPPRTASTWANLREGFAWIRGNRLPRALVWLIAAASIFAFPYAMLLPVFARDVLGVGAQGLGWLLSATGAGALAGGIALAAIGSRVRRGPLLLVSSIAFTVLLGSFALSRSFVLSLCLLAAAGFMMILNNATTNALLQSLVPDALRGRVMGVYVFMFLGMTPIGSLQAGTLARWLGAPIALAMGATVLLGIILLVWSRVPELREVR